MRDTTSSLFMSEFHVKHLQLVNITCTISSEHYHGKCARLIGDFVTSSQRSLQTCSAQGVGRVIYLRLIFEGESLDIVRQREAGIDLEMQHARASWCRHDMVLSTTAVSRVNGILWKEFEELQHRGLSCFTGAGRRSPIRRRAV